MINTKVDIKIDQDRCKGCDLCLTVCPGKVFQESDEVGVKGFNPRTVKQTNGCTNCGLCKLFCPEGAILIENKSRFDELLLPAQRNISASKRGGWKKSKSLHPGRHFISGSTACAWAAIDAGCRFFAGYPIEPANEQFYEMEHLMPDNHGVFIQMESEDAAMAAISGASLGGVKAMTSTSDPGFERMLENIAFALANELPLVVVVVQRTSPSTGRPSGTGAWLVRGTRWGPHGGTEHVVLYPSTVQDIYNQTIKAFNLTEMLRCPIIVLMEASNAHLMEAIEIPRELDLFDRMYIPMNPPFGPTADRSVPSMPRFGDGELLKVTGLTHNERGIPYPTDPAVHERMIAHLRAKIISRADEMIDVEEYLLDDAEVMFVAYGHTARSAKWAVNEARKKAIKVGLLTLKTLYPFPEKIIEKWSKQVKCLLVPEMNQGQLFYVIRESSFAPIISLPQPNGESIHPDRILHFLMTMGEKYNRINTYNRPNTIYDPPEWKVEQGSPRSNDKTFSDKTPFCPGCGLGILRNCLLDSIQGINLPKEDIVLVSGVGCSARLCNHIPFDSANTTHGYSIPFGTGVKLARPDLHVIAVSGDGDLFEIGAGQTIHGAHRHKQLTVICCNNFVLGMTGGQVAATTPHNAITSTTTNGNPGRPLDIVSIMLSSNAGYVARCPTNDVKVLKKLLAGALTFNGFSFVEVVSPCLKGYGRRNMLSSAAELWKRLNDTYIPKDKIKNMTEADIRKKHGILFPFAEKVSREELLQIVYGRFFNLKEYLSLIQQEVQD